jgi:hypothetical protein
MPLLQVWNIIWQDFINLLRLCHVCKEGRYLIINNNYLVSPSGDECQCIDAYGMLVDIAEKLNVGFSRKKARYLTIDDRM